MLYALCGLKTESDLPLADLLPWTGETHAPDIEIRLGEVPERLEDPVHRGPLLQVGKDGTCRFAVADVADYLVEDGRRITVRPRMAPDAPDVRVFLLGSVFGFLCHQRGLLPLHAGCVEIGGRAVAFAGDSGAGKSTLTAAFLRRGHRMLADDVTVVDTNAPGGPLVLPSFPRIKLWRDAMGGLGLSDEGLERSRTQSEKFHMPVETGFRAEPLRLEAIYQLCLADGTNPTGFSPLRGVSKIDALIKAVYRHGEAVHMGLRTTMLTAVMRLSALPFIRFARTPGLSELDETVAMLARRHQR